MVSAQYSLSLLAYLSGGVSHILQSSRRIFADVETIGPGREWNNIDKGFVIIDRPGSENKQRSLFHMMLLNWLTKPKRRLMSSIWTLHASRQSWKSTDVDSFDSRINRKDGLLGGLYAFNSDCDTLSISGLRAGGAVAAVHLVKRKRRKRMKTSSVS